jgi:hypothetical protein
MSSSQATCGTKLPAKDATDGGTKVKSSTRQFAWEQLSGFGFGNRAGRRRRAQATPTTGGPFMIAEFVAHDSRVEFRSLNHAHGHTMYRMAHRRGANALELLPLSAHSTHGWTCCRLDPIENHSQMTFWCESRIAINLSTCGPLSKSQNFLNASH